MVQQRGKAWEEKRRIGGVYVARLVGRERGMPIQLSHEEKWKQQQQIELFLGGTESEQRSSRKDHAWVIFPRWFSICGSSTP